MKKIKIESGIKYLSESKEIKSLPTNCLFDKGKVGCGGTTLAINSDKPYVIAVPFVSLIENKMAQHKNILGVYEGITMAHIKSYVANTKKPIIMTTYDSLDKVTKSIDACNFNILIDEYHLLFTQYSFRESSINTVLDNYKKYKEYCFMTATPVEEEFILDELKGLEVVVAEWEDVAEVEVKSILCPNGVLNSTIDLVNLFLDGKEEGNLYVFVNSVSFIKDIVENTEVDNSNCNIIYSKNNKTDVGLNRGVLPCNREGRILPKKINLLTSTVFEGADIYDENGKTYIVSDASKAHTLIDISTSFQQIAGRIRNSKYIKEINHMYSNTRYNHLSYEDFKMLSLNEIEKCKEVVLEYNNLSSAAKQMMQVRPNETYISTEESSFRFNPNLVKLDLYNFKVCKHLYKIRVNVLQDELNKYGYKNTEYKHTTETRISPRDLEGFQEVVEHIKTFYSAFTTYTAEQISTLEAAYVRFPFLKEAIYKLGFQGIEDEKYIQTNIKRKLATMLNVNDETKVYKLLKTHNDVTAGSFIPASVLKERFKKIYAELNLNLTAKGSDIEKYFYAKEVTTRVKGKLVKGYLLANPKMIIK